MSPTEVSPVPLDGRARSALLKSQMPGIDALRGVAVLCVVFFHGLRWTLPAHQTISRAAADVTALFTFGWLGVTLFFVLSGFLITGILLDTRTRSNYWSSFYTRRVLRILPLYLLLLFYLRACSIITWPYFFVCLLYLANFSRTFTAGVEYGPLWSLAVEEQFYLVWPLLVRRLQQKSVAWICLACLVLSPILRAISVGGIVSLGNPYSTTWLITDGLATGALLAVFLRTSFATPDRIRRVMVALWISGVAFLSAGLKLHILTRSTAAGAAFQPEPFLLLFVFLLMAALRFGDRPTVLRLTAPLRFYGYISYGLYLIHLLSFSAYDKLAERFHPAAPNLDAPALIFRFAIVLLFSTALCFLLRRYFEEAFLRLKDRLVPYSKATHATR